MPLRAQLCANSFRETLEAECNKAVKEGFVGYLDAEILADEVRPDGEVLHVANLVRRPPGSPEPPNTVRCVIGFNEAQT
jgi:hypothetical protein